MLHPLERGAQAMLASASIATVATATHRINPADSQDAAFAVVRPDYRAVIVADGMGALAGSGRAARHCATEAQVRYQEAVDFPDPLGVFEGVQQSLTEAVPGWLDEMEPATRERIDPDQAFGTTLLVGAETEDALLIAYAGNGCAFHLRGDFAAFPAHMPLPWSWINLLSPHTACENGREALYRYLSPASSPRMAKPSLVVLAADQTFGDILVLATDGLFSADQARHGCDPEGEVWIGAGKPLIALHAVLRALFLQPGELTTEIVQAALNACLEGLRGRGLLDDDTTLGLIITPQALAYRNTLLATVADTEKGA